MKKVKHLQIILMAVILEIAGISFGQGKGLLSDVLFSAAYAQEQESLMEEELVLQIPGSNGKYMKKAEGFYCQNEDGSLDACPAIHYFDHFKIGKTVFNGYYYHDETGKFKAADDYRVNISQEVLPVDDNGNTKKGWEPGIYLVNNLGKLFGTGRICYLEEETAQKKLNGYYYITENGRLALEGGIHYVSQMECKDRSFHGYYYFDPQSGALAAGEAKVQNLTVEADGKVTELTEPGTQNLKKKLEELLTGYEGAWSVFVKDLGNGEQFSIHNRSMTSASLIKAFAMAASYENMDSLREQEGNLLKADPLSDKVLNKLYGLMENMVTFSDNESFNEVVRLQTASMQFNAGARKINRYLREQGYKETSVLHTLAPSDSKPEGIGGSNTTSVEDCGKLLESIYRGECVSEEASRQMQSFLLMQDTKNKIPAGLDDSVTVANKTGENDSNQHDIAIVYGKRTDYILCVMSENGGLEETAVSNICKISALAYYYLNW